MEDVRNDIELLKRNLNELTGNVNKVKKDSESRDEHIKSIEELIRTMNETINFIGRKIDSQIEKKNQEEVTEIYFEFNLSIISGRG